MSRRSPVFARQMYQWGRSLGARVRTGALEMPAWRNADGTPIPWQTSDKPFPRGFRAGLAGSEVSR